MNTNRECPHCIWMTTSGLFHTKLCRCNHHHADHISFSGCTVKGCLCDRYDQTVAYVAPKEVSTPKILAVAALINTSALEQLIAEDNPDTLGKVQARIDQLKKQLN